MSDRILFIGVGVGLAAYLLVSLIQFALFLRKHAGETDALPEGEVTITLPMKCRPYLGDGTERWIDCMGVGYVREEDNEHD